MSGHGLMVTVAVLTLACSSACSSSSSSSDGGWQPPDGASSGTCLLDEHCPDGWECVRTETPLPGLPDFGVCVEGDAGLEVDAGDDVDASSSDAGDAGLEVDAGDDVDASSSDAGVDAGPPRDGGPCDAPRHYGRADLTITGCSSSPIAGTTDVSVEHRADCSLLMVTVSGPCGDLFFRDGATSTSAALCPAMYGTRTFTVDDVVGELRDGACSVRWGRP